MITLLSYLSGNFTHNNDTGGKAIFREKYATNTVFRTHTSTGTLSKTNAGPNTRGAQDTTRSAG